MAERRVRWGIISTANIGMKQVTPGIMKSPHSEVVALASREVGMAEAALVQLGLPQARAYGTYEELLADPDIDAVYNPLPNHLHGGRDFARRSGDRGRDRLDRNAQLAGRQELQ